MSAEGQVVEVSPPLPANVTPTKSIVPDKPTAGVLTAFLSKLWKITQDKNEKICGWSEDGTKFEVRSDAFERDMVRKHFHGGNMTTFVRQLHFYGFRKTGEENGRWSFSHPKFRRDSPHLLHQITRKTRTTQSDIAERESLRAEVIEMRKELNELKRAFSSFVEQGPDYRPGKLVPPPPEAAPPSYNNISADAPPPPGDSDTSPPPASAAATSLETLASNAIPCPEDPNDDDDAESASKRDRSDSGSGGGLDPKKRARAGRQAKAAKA